VSVKSEFVGQAPSSGRLIEVEFERRLGNEDICLSCQRRPLKLSLAVGSKHKQIRYLQRVEEQRRVSRVLIAVASIFASELAVPFFQ
jgi:hypothetical protein